MKAGERPDTIHMENLPCKWFVNYQDKSGLAHDKPSDYVLKKAFSTFGEIKLVDIPMLDPYRHKMKKSVSGLKTFSFGQDLVFEAYIQYKEYIGFVKAMNALKGMKLCYKDRESSRAWTSSVKVDFDKSKHLSDSMIKQRKGERERLIKEERDKEVEENRRKNIEEMQMSKELQKMDAEERERKEKKMAKALVATQRRMAREEKRKAKRLKKMGLTEEEEMAEKIGIEERKLMIAQRKLESIRILDELLERVKATNKSKDDTKSLGKIVIEAARKDAAGKRGETSENLRDKEREIREKLGLKLKKKVESDIEHQQGKINRVKTDGFESVSDDDLSSTLDNVSNEEMEEVSNEESDQDSSSENETVSEIDSEELRLTSTEEDSEHESPKKKKRKKEKKDKKKRKHSDRDSRKERELKKQINIAERIASRRSPVRRERENRRQDFWEHEKYDRERSRRERTPTGYYGAKDYYERRRRSVEREERDRAPLDEFERDEYERRKFLNSANLKKVNRFLTQSGMRKEQVEREMERAYEKYFSSLAKKEGGRYAGPKSEEQAKEEQWERMTNPHLFGGSGGGGFRKVKVGQHYEEVQKEVLQHEIRIRERRYKMDYQRSKERGDYRDRGSSRRESRRDRW